MRKLNLDVEYIVDMNKSRIFILVRFLIFFILTDAYTQMQILTVTSTNTDTTELMICRKLINKFCSLWKDRQYNVMYTMIDSSVKRDINEKKFINLYGTGADGRGMVSYYSIKTIIKEQNDFVVMVDMKFKSEKAPMLVNGLYSIHLICLNDELFTIRAFVAPLRVPALRNTIDGDHPGR